MIKKLTEEEINDFVGYRPDTKIVDCTIRDGGLMNAHKFSDEFVTAVYEANIAAGVDYMEFGYKADCDQFDPEENGKWKFTKEEDLRSIVGDNDTDLKISVMADIGRTNLDRDILPKDQSVIDMIRVACYIHQVPEAIEMIKDVKGKGYEVCANIMAVSTAQESEVCEGARQLAASGINALYVVDSFGSLHSLQARHLTELYLDICKDHGVKLGIHAHNNLQMAYANTVNCMVQGVSYLDGSLAGLGRGAGNCPTEMLLGFLHNPQYHVRPALKVIQEHILPLKEHITWGFDHAYMITGLLNQHPRSAIAHNDGSDPENLLKFFDEMTEDE